MDEIRKEEGKIDSDIQVLISKDRVMGFSDAVFAFAATLLVLKIDLPVVTAVQLSSTTTFVDLFRDLWPQYLANILSFIIIGYYWVNHHAIFGMVKKFDMTIVWINLFFLICLSFLPFPVDLYGSYYTVPLVVVFYSASLAAVGYFLFFVWWYASHNRNLISKTISDKQIRYYSIRNLIAPIVFTLAIPLVYIHPMLAEVCWVFILLGIYIVNKIFHEKEISDIEKSSI